MCNKLCLFFFWALYIGLCVGQGKFWVGVWISTSFVVGYSPKTPGSDPYQPPDPYATTPAAIPDGYEMTTSIFPLDSCYFNK